MKNKSTSFFALFLMSALVSTANAGDVRSAACSASVFEETQNFHDFQDPIQKIPSKIFALKGDEVAHEITTLDGVTYNIIDVKTFVGHHVILEVQTASGKTRTLEGYPTHGGSSTISHVANGKNTVV